tara:strand:+ start:217 stop:1125 length:909 start_codon:yes stop_codon:yes gene_type:complete
MPVKIVNKEPVEYYSNLEGSLDSSLPLNQQFLKDWNVNQNITPVNLNQPRSHAETFLDLYKNSPTTRDYNINVNADLANRISGGIRSVPVIGGALSTMADVAMPAAAFIGSPFYDTIQGAYRGITDPDKSVWQAIKDENIGSTMWERMLGASAPLSKRLSNWKDDFSTYGKAFAGDYIQNSKIQQFKQQQIMNRRKQQMQKTIRQAEAAEAAKKKITTGGSPSITQTRKHKTPGGGGYGPHKKTKKTKKWTAPQQTGGGGNIHAGGQKSSKTSAPQRDYSRHSAYGLKQGGLVNFYKYGGFV